MSDLYVKVLWPEIQDYMDHPRYNECYMCESLGENDEPIVSVYMVPEDLYVEVQMDKYPKEIVFEGETYETFWTYVNRGDAVLLELGNGERKVLKASVSSKPPLYGPVLFDDHNYVPGINCDILGVKHL